MLIGYDHLYIMMCINAKSPAKFCFMTTAKCQIFQLFETSANQYEICISYLRKLFVTSYAKGMNGKFTLYNNNNNNHPPPPPPVLTSSRFQALLDAFQDQDTLSVDNQKGASAIDFIQRQGTSGSHEYIVE